ncbi:MAG: mannose-6-phosphate isomerase, class I [Spirochaetaceae bacterium]|nr:MAG: mannose-6-phosphate isomerase, class I [Spirochaetaceae bacterium]
MDNTVQRYAWGSRDALTRLYGFSNPRRDPMAELWMGAHDKAPSKLVVDGVARPLGDHIAADSDAVLGRAASIDTGSSAATLPYLFKILCAGEPLSIQVHPSRDLAASGYAAEQERGTPIDAPDRNYRDANHKPELICAITPFWGLRGFRPIDSIGKDFAADEFADCDVDIAAPRDEADLRRFLTSVLTLDDDQRREVIAAAIALAESRWRAGADEPPAVGDESARFYWIQRIADVYPGDPGILSPLFLNVFSLRPGQATYQPAGVLHAYLGGVGAELMACSDNVLRGGMTVKHVDVAELERAVSFRSEEPVVMDGEPVELVPGFVRYPTPFAEFELWRGTIAGSVTVPGGVPQIVFCHDGSARLRAGGAVVELAPGESAFADAAAPVIEVDANATVFVARVP